MHEGIAHHGQDGKKMKSSAEAPSVSGEIGGKAEKAPVAFEIGADRVGVNPKHEALAAQIKEKEATRDALMKSWKTKFDAVKAAKAENDRHKETITRLHATGKISPEAYEAELASIQEKFDGGMADAQKDLDLASEYREEIDRLKDELEGGAN